MFHCSTWTPIFGDANALIKKFKICDFSLFGFFEKVHYHWEKGVELLFEKSSISSNSQDVTNLPLKSSKRRWFYTMLQCSKFSLFWLFWLLSMLKKRWWAFRKKSISGATLGSACHTAKAYWKVSYATILSLGLIYGWSVCHFLN